MPTRFDEDGFLIAPPEVTAEEKAAVLAYAKAVYVPGSQDDKGLALSHMRKPQSGQSLQSLQRVVDALVSEGLLREVSVPTKKGGWKVYHPTSP